MKALLACLRDDGRVTQCFKLTNSNRHTAVLCSLAAPAEREKVQVCRHWQAISQAIKYTTYTVQSSDASSITSDEKESVLYFSSEVKREPKRKVGGQKNFCGPLNFNLLLTHMCFYYKRITDAQITGW